MENLILSDKTEIEIQDGASLGKITALVSGWGDAETLANKLTTENLKNVQFSSDGDIYGSYSNMSLVIPLHITPGNPMVVEFGIRKRAEEEFQQEQVQTAISYLSDEQALSVKSLYKDWNSDPDGYHYSTENPEDLRRNFNGGLWKLNKDHDKQDGWYPGADPTLWTEIVEGHDGTLEDPIPVPESVTTSGFDYIYGKYYSENGEIYLCKRSGVSNPEEMYGKTEKLFFVPSTLVGNYFVKVE